MSEDDFMMSADEEDFDFDDMDDDVEGPDDQTEANSPENLYYNAKALKEDDAQGAIAEFEALIEAHADEEYGFKASKQVAKLQLAAGDENVLKSMDRVFAYANSASVAKNHFEKSLNNILDLITGAEVNSDLQDKVYERALAAVAQSNNDRLWVRIGLRLAKGYLDSEQIGPAQAHLDQMEARLEANTTMAENTKSTYLLELYALKIQLCTLTDSFKTLKRLYSHTLSIKSAIPHPKILGVIHECGGKMLLRERQFRAAAEEFFQGFRNYDEAGASERIRVLRYYVMASVLSDTGINPFDSQETVPYKAHPDISYLAEIVDAYQSANIEEFSRLHKAYRSRIDSDRYTRDAFADVVTLIRAQALVNFVKPYSRVTVVSLAEWLGMTADEVLMLVVNLILDGKLAGARINRVDNYVEFNSTFGRTSSQVIMASAFRDKPVDLPSRYSDSKTDERQQEELAQLTKATVTADQGRQLDRTSVLQRLLESLRVVLSAGIHQVI